MAARPAQAAALAGLFALCTPAGAQQMTVVPVPRGAMPVLAPVLSPTLNAPLSGGLAANTLFSPSAPSLNTLLPSVSRPGLSPVSPAAGSTALTAGQPSAVSRAPALRAALSPRADNSVPAARVTEARATAGGSLEGAWTPENRERLEKLIQDYGRNGPNWDASKPPLATFDWDNTMIRNDIGEAVFFHSIREMRFKFERGDRFWNLIPKEFGRDAIRENLEAIQRLPVEQAKQTPEYKRYRKLFHQAYELVKLHGEEMNVDYGWLVQLMAGFTVPELERLADEVIAFEAGRPVGQETIAESDADPSPLHIPAGIRPYAEMFLLARRLQEAGWDVRIVSATAEWIVARFARLAGIARDKVHGVLTRMSRGRLTTRLTQRTWKQGKADTILRRAGRRNKLAAGDSNSDIQMLQLSEGERLVIDLRKEPLGSIALKGGWLIQPPFQVSQ